MTIKRTNSGRPKRLKSKRRPLVHGIFQDSLVFADREQATEIAAFWTAKTWGELRVSAPKLYRDALRRWIDEGTQRPKASEPLLHADVPGVQDGDFPQWLLQEMLRLLPEDVARRFAMHTFSFASGEALTISPAREAEALRAMRALGYRCVKDQKLISKAADL
jgi:hypothetical protein